MNHYLQVRVGPYQILLDADGIHEILELDRDDGAKAAGRYDWRGQALCTVNGRILLGMKDNVPPRKWMGVVYNTDIDAALLMLEFDHVVGLRHLNDMSLQPLPLVSERVMQLFDGVFLDKQTGVQLYHLRRPLNAELLMEQTDAVGLLTPFTREETEIDEFVSNEVNETVLNEIDTSVLGAVEEPVLSEDEQSTMTALPADIAKPLEKKPRSRGKRKE